LFETHSDVFELVLQGSFLINTNLTHAGSVGRRSLVSFPWFHLSQIGHSIRTKISNVTFVVLFLSIHCVGEENGTDLLDHVLI